MHFLGEKVAVILEKNFQSAALEVKRMRVETGLELSLPQDITDAQLKSTVIDIPASLDGSWNGRIQALNGIVVCISADTGKALDRHFMSKGCTGCRRWADKDHNTIEYLEWYVTFSHHVLALLSTNDQLSLTLGATISSHALCLYVLMMECMGNIVLARDPPIDLFVYKTSSVSPMHHKSKRTRQKAWDDGVAPSFN